VIADPIITRRKFIKGTNNDVAGNDSSILIPPNRILVTVKKKKSPNVVKFLEYYLHINNEELSVPLRTETYRFNHLTVNL
jgi:hypothetical protein